MNRTVRIQFVEKGSAENPIAPRHWGFVPRVGDDVMLPETGRVHRVLAVQWNCTRREDGSYDADEPLVIVTVAG